MLVQVSPSETLTAAAHLVADATAIQDTAIEVAGDQSTFDRVAAQVAEMFRTQHV